MKHVPVMFKEVVEIFNYLKDGYFVDGTLGAGGHSLAIARDYQSSKINYQIVGVDKDKEAIELARENIKKAGLGDNFIFIHNDFKEIKAILAKLKIEKINGALIDLGVSSMQLDQSERGFTFQDPDAPLDMRMNKDQNLDALTVLNSYPEEKLAKIIFDFGEDRNARKIAKSIIKNRPLNYVGDLLSAIEAAVPPKERFGSSKHFATRTFQAIRIEVNSELNQLDRAISDFADFLTAGSKLAIISFHSLEDRIIKNTFKKLENPCQCPPEIPCICGKKPIVKILTKRPIIAGEEEVSVNPRSRSAKFRVVEKI